MSYPYREKWTSECGTVTLYCGDCLEILPTLAPGSVDAVVTDPPYKTAYVHTGEGMPVNGRFSCRRLAEPVKGYDQQFDPRPFLSFPCVMFGADQYCDKLSGGGVFHVWDKACGVGPDDSFSDVEIIWTSWQMARVVIRYLWKGVCQQGEKSRKKMHPSQKPESVMSRVISLVDEKHNVIFDPYMGSGTTGVACVRLGRRFIGIELEPKYYAIAKRRIQDELNRVKFLEPKQRETQRTLLEVET